MIKRSLCALLVAFTAAAALATAHDATAGVFGAQASCNILFRGPWPGPVFTNGVDICAGPETIAPQVIGTETLPQYDTDGWQCVELAERFFIANHWWPAKIFNLPHGAATDLWYYPQSAVLAGATITLKRIANGLITSADILPGDLLVAADGGPGHVAVITKVYPDHVAVAEENYSGTGFATYSLSGGWLSRPGETVLGVLENPASDAWGLQVTDGWVKQAYLDLLGRAPDSSTVNYWNNTLIYQLSRRELAHVFDTSAEYDALGVRGLYESLLGRDPDGSSSSYWSSYIQNGHTWEQLEEAILGSPEYYSGQGGTPTGLVDDLYWDVLGRFPSASTLQYWVSKLNGGLSRQSFATAVVESPEGYSDRAAAWYRHYLRRSATATEINDNVAALQRGTTDQQLIANIVGSPEYEQIASKNANS